MANSRTRGPLDTSTLDFQPFTDDVAGPIGVRFNDFGIRNSPGSLGLNDWAAFVGTVCTFAAPMASTARLFESRRAAMRLPRYVIL